MSYPSNRPNVNLLRPNDCIDFTRDVNRSFVYIVKMIIIYNTRTYYVNVQYRTDYLKITRYVYRRGNTIGRNAIDEREKGSFFARYDLSFIHRLSVVIILYWQNGARDVARVIPPSS